jgi:hypothetical protein
VKFWQVRSGLPRFANTMWCSISRLIGIGAPSASTTSTCMLVTNPFTSGLGIPSWISLVSTWKGATVMGP